MKKNKRGLSGVITTLIIILLVVVATGMVWVVVKNLIIKNVDKASGSVRCLDTSVGISYAICGGTSNSVCNVTLTKNSGQEVLLGVREIFSSPESSSNYVKTLNGDIPLLTTKKDSEVQTGLTNVNKIEIAIILQDDSGQPIECPVSASQKLSYD